MFKFFSITAFLSAEFHQRRYLVSPLLIAAIAAFNIFWGIEIWSPMPSDIMSFPCAFSSAAFIETAIVGEALILEREFAKKDIDF